MEIGDLVDDGFDNIGIIVELGWFFLRVKAKPVLISFTSPTLPRTGGTAIMIWRQYANRRFSTVCRPRY